MDRRQTISSAELRKSDDDDQARITGLGAVYYDGTSETEYKLWDRCYERIAPGAFDKAIRSDDVRGLFNHDPNCVLGRTSSGTMVLTGTKRGLQYEITPADTTTGRDVVEHIRRGDVTGASFAFSVTDQEWRKEGEGDDQIEIREIKAVKLYDCGPVTFPAYQGATAEMCSEARAARDSFFVEAEPADERPDLETYRCRVAALQADLAE